MSNLSYCRFENTLADLRDCESALGETGLSRSEQQARDDLIELCADIAELATLRAQRDALRDALTRIAAIPLGSLAKNSCAGTIAVNVARAALDGDK